MTSRRNSQSLPRSSMARSSSEEPNFRRLRLTADLRRLGEGPGDRDAGGRPKWAQIRHGVVAPAAWWAASTPEEQHASLVYASAMQMRGSRLLGFSHTSAGALRSLPRISPWPKHVEVTSPRSTVRSSGLMKRHIGEVDQYDVIDGLLVTTLTRTIIDIARTEELWDAVAAADHVLHQKTCTRADLVAELDKVPAGARGRARAALVVDFADPGAMSAGESLSRVQMFRLNIPRPQLQVPIEDDDGLVGVGDFWWERERVVGEFDGLKKYRVSDGMNPEESTQVLWREKKREDRIRATDRKMARWVWPKLRDLT